MRTNRTNARYLVLAAVVILLVVQTGVVAAVPQLTITPETLDRTDNASIPVNVANDTAFNITNQNQTKHIYNVTLPERPWLTWSANHFDLNVSTTRTVNATITPHEAGNLTDQFEIPYEYNQTRLNESQYGRSWQMTFDKNHYPSLQVMIDAYYRSMCSKPLPRRNLTSWRKSRNWRCSPNWTKRNANSSPHCWTIFSAP